jgi:hypothetical protein
MKSVFPFGSIAIGFCGVREECADSPDDVRSSMRPDTSDRPAGKRIV